MCRLFGFRSVFQSKVHSSLIHAENALTSQSVKHPDGWGVAYFLESIPHIIKSTQRAIDDHIFQKVSGVVTSKTVIAHLRKATQGKLNILNSHPFQYGKWVFAHNGNIKDYNKHKSKLINLIDKDLKSFILGTTDSEVLFFIILSEIKRIQGDSNLEGVTFEQLQTAIENAVQKVCQHIGPLYGGNANNPEENHTTLIITNGDLFCALQGGQKIYFSTHKSSCSESTHCNFFNQTCENLSKDNSQVNHLIISSEELKGENIWTELEKGELVGIDDKMLFRQKKLNIPFTSY